MTYEMFIFWQAKADEISRLMVENEQLKATLEELKVRTKLISYAS